MLTAASSLATFQIRINPKSLCLLVLARYGLRVRQRLSSERSEQAAGLKALGSMHEICINFSPITSEMNRFSNDSEEDG